MSQIPATAILLTFLGTASFLIQQGDTRILMDPGDFLTNRFTREKAESLKGIDLILVTHTDFDHINRLAFIPDARSIPVFGPCSIKDALPGYHCFTDKEYVIGDIKITKFRSIHGIRHDVIHTGFIIDMGSKLLYNMGDGYRLEEVVKAGPDFLFLTLSGMEANIENGLKNVDILQPKTVIPMHWETLFRCDGKPRKFEKKLKEQFPSIKCIIPPYDKTIVLQ
ncbi:MAG: MBL fold metallo-hydrolase [Spirochaetales bacterium]|nr:MBL fold metallo-hydrolase [Spirochaetales bacterium]